MKTTFFIILLLSLFQVGCGYSFRTSKGPGPFAGVKTLHVKNFKATGADTGTELVLTNALIKELNSTGRWKIVSDPSQADALVIGTLGGANSSITSKSTASELPGCESATDDGFACPDESISGGEDALVVSSYRAALSIHIRIVDRNDKVLFSQSFSGTQDYPASNRLGKGGATNVLVNRSREQITFEKMGESIMNEVVSIMLEGV